VNVDEDWRAERSYLGKDGVEKIYIRFLERKNKEFILSHARISLKAQNTIYTT
jgi:hypothetical protein